MAQVLRFPSIQTAAQDPRVRAAIADFEHRQELRATIRVQRGIIWGLIAALILAGWWLA